ncbi:MAG: hypothetical protein FWG89_09535 [Treponema sp.]|nr:hypothetical protein [Treponema sp.]
MKNIIKLFGVIALIAVIGFTMAACGGDGSPPPPPPPGSFGATLTLSGQVFLYNENTRQYTALPSEDDDYGEVTAIFYDDENDVSHDLGGTGLINNNGRLNFTIGTPDHLLDISEIRLTNWFDDRWNNFTLSSPAVDAIQLRLRLEIWGVTGIFSREYETATSHDEVIYTYVTSDVTMSANSKSESGVEDGVAWTETVNGFTINLKAGWNAILHKYVWTESASGYVGISTISIANPSNLRWVINF